LTAGSGGWTFAVIYNFCMQYGCPDGESPSAGLVMDKGGNLDGTAGGGAYGWGVTFALTPGSGGWNETVLYNFAGPPKDSSASYAPLTLDGNLYGTSQRGELYSAAPSSGCKKVRATGRTVSFTAFAGEGFPAKTAKDQLRGSCSTAQEISTVQPPVAAGHATGIWGCVARCSS